MTALIRRFLHPLQLGFVLFALGTGTAVAGPQSGDEGQSNEFAGRSAPNPDAPAELSLFDFLVGKWHCEGIYKADDGQEHEFQATWTGHYILDGYAIADEYRMLGPDGKPVMLGQNFRAYNRAHGAWRMRWLDALKGDWIELAPERLGGVEAGDGYITFKTRGDDETIKRIRFSDISEDSFTWTSDQSKDGGETWRESVAVIKARRINE